MVTALASLYHFQLRTIEAVKGEELERRLAAVENRLKMGDKPANENLDSPQIAEVVKQ